jgi:hypothetical protein
VTFVASSEVKVVGTYFPFWKYGPLIWSSMRKTEEIFGDDRI